jgi:hypothetical protein
MRNIAVFVIAVMAAGCGNVRSEPDAGGACQPDELRCEANQPQRCVGGQWEDQAACAAPRNTCSAGACVAPSCRDGKQCSGIGCCDSYFLTGFSYPMGRSTSGSDAFANGKASDELSPVRRDYQLVVLLTGLRRMDAATIRWEHVDFAARTLHRPSPKGGADRAFTIPLSRACFEILERRRAENRDDAGWAFPTDAMKGRACDLCAELGLPRHRVGARIHLVEAKEAADEIVSPHRLRDTYTSALAEVGGINEREERQRVSRCRSDSASSPSRSAW